MSDRPPLPTALGAIPTAPDCAAARPQATIEYVAGFLFSADRLHVALIHKEKPAWQRGKYNAIGGKIEAGETPHEAMVREFREETGIEVFDSIWRPVAVLSGPGFGVHFWAAFSDEIYSVDSPTEERVDIFRVTTALGLKNLIPNLKVMIPLALDDTGIAKPVLINDERRAAA